ncbi:hypothetical protein CUT44_17510 [Streptomyces carminius]|uniref:Uncharacterized protein n=1 Tax=Streptomyces carminius TaxID=2665496 RepID=A0A2M8LWL6_9ACTN|nr:hypothetical protein [Streptomyces carminius]PJE96331.1 hypothetical protein CUT44_17510 [Streptomyces carminius]
MTGRAEPRTGAYGPAGAGAGEAAARWLLGAAPDRAAARAEWETHGVALLWCGEVFSAVRLPAALVYAATAAREPGAVDARLRDALCGGPVFAGAYWRRYYALVRAGAEREWAWERDRTGAECLGEGTRLGVPHPDLTECRPGRAYWCVPPRCPGPLCPPAAVSRFVALGRLLLGEGA